jgi:signal transduction histidine kinase
MVQMKESSSSLTKSDQKRIQEFIEAIRLVAKGDYSVQLKLSDENNMLDSLAMGLNMMIDEVKQIADAAFQHEQIKKINTDLQIAKERAEESDRLKSAFLANMSHEIRTPMNGILGFAALLKKPELTGEQQQKYIGIIEKSGERMLNIINDLIEISKIESGQMSISLAPTNINEQLEFIYSFFRNEVEKKGMKLTYDYVLPDHEAIINTDREKIYAIIINLVKNAIKYSLEGEISFGYQKVRNMIEFYVRDTGIGIAANKLDEVFERFVQGEETVTRKYEGAGLGLAITKAFVEMLGGRIWVESKVGEGSTFYFTIPYVPISEELSIITYKTSPADEIHPNKKLKVLIAEDDLVTTMLLTNMLEEYVGEIFVVENGLQAVETCRKNSGINLVLMDIKMSKMNGYEAVRQIRSFNRNVIIIAQTAYALAGEKDKVLKAGCNDYMAKPLHKEALLAIIEKHAKL